MSGLLPDCSMINAAPRCSAKLVWQKTGKRTYSLSVDREISDLRVSFREQDMQGQLKVNRLIGQGGTMMGIHGMFHAVQGEVWPPGTALMTVLTTDPTVKSAADLDKFVDYKFYSKGLPKTVAIRGSAAWRLSGYAPDTVRPVEGEPGWPAAADRPRDRDEL